MISETTQPSQMKIRILDSNDHIWLKQHAENTDRSINYIINQAIKLYKQVKGVNV